MSTGTIPAGDTNEVVLNLKNGKLHTITASNDGIGVVIVTTTVGA